MNKLSELLLCLALLIPFSACKNNKGVETSPARDYLSEVKSVNKLITARMVISKMATIDDLKLEDAKGTRQTLDAIADALKVGDRKAAFSYDTYFKAYLDMSELQPGDVTVDEGARIITVNLPAVHTDLSDRDAELREVHYRVTGMRSQLGPEERAKVKERMNDLLKKEVTGKPVFRDHLVRESKFNAEKYFRSLLATEGYEVIVKFKDEKV